MFDDLLAANERYAAGFVDKGLEGRAAKRLAVVTCIDSRIDPLAMLGLEAGDAKIMRNAGARVTDDMLRSLILAVNLLDVDRICLVQHTDCAMAKHSNAELHELLRSHGGVDAAEWDFLAIGDQAEAARNDIKKIKTCSLIPTSVETAGFLYDVRTGVLSPL